MQLGSLALLYLGSVAFFGLEAAKLDVASDFKRKWTKWALSRARRDVKLPAATLLAGQGAEANARPLVRPQDVKDEPGVAQPSREDAHIRVKRYRASSYAHLSPSGHVGCRFGTCTMHKLAHQIYRLTDKDKDGSAPVNKISPQGYGRRRRSLREAPSALEGSSSRRLSRLLASWSTSRLARP
ncbi:pro-adrenomedullin isoform X2 [Tiliqua scincoides]|uniref:pro-adrenomedullin isoform X2 n=1 Tax=Tiliqua scincoides TaxID=71010 RepID=UPI003463313F